MNAVKFDTKACPTCKVEVDLGVNMSKTEKEPKPGNIAVCMNCGEILIFNQDMTLRESTLSDILKIRPDIMVQVLECQLAVRQGKPPTKENGR
jgi:hypothetical protein